MNFLNIFEDHVAGIFGATRAPFSFKKLAKQAARDMEDQTLVINGVNTAPALYTILIAADDDPMLAPFYPELSREVRCLTLWLFSETYLTQKDEQALQAALTAQYGLRRAELHLHFPEALLPQMDALLFARAAPI